MRIEENRSFYVGEKSFEQERNENTQRKTLFAGELGPENLESRIEKRREDAREKALKLVGDVFARDRAVDEEQQARRDRAAALSKENKTLKERLVSLEEESSALREKYDMAADDTKKLEYQEHQLSLEDEKKQYENLLCQNEREIIQENAIVRGVSLERLKSAPMVKAAKQAEEILKAAGEEIVSMIVEDAEEKLEEKEEEREEKAEKLNEQREEAEEFLEKSKEHREETEILEDMPTEEMISLDIDKENLKKELSELADKMKLVAEDLKGAMVDTQV